jgi:hypothetical protein
MIADVLSRAEEKRIMIFFFKRFDRGNYNC